MLSLALWLVKAMKRVTHISSKRYRQALQMVNAVQSSTNRYFADFVLSVEHKLSLGQRIQLIDSVARMLGTEPGALYPEYALLFRQYEYELANREDN